MILFNTCSVREKAQEKVFHDLGGSGPEEAEPESGDRCRRLRGVAGGRCDCRAGAVCRCGVRPANVAPAAGTDREKRQTGRSQVDISFPEIEKFDSMPPARGAASAFVSIMEGCSKYCTFCVVPYTRAVRKYRGRSRTC